MYGRYIAIRSTEHYRDVVAGQREHLLAVRGTVRVTRSTCQKPRLC
jgi:hypothetical protein